VRLIWVAMGVSDQIADARHWVTEHKLKAIGGLWATGIVGSLGFQWSRPIPTQMKIIHSRVYSQAITLGAIGFAASAEFYERTYGQKTEDPEETRVKNLEKEQLEKAKRTGHVHKT